MLLGMGCTYEFDIGLMHETMLVPVWYISILYMYNISFGTHQYILVCTHQHGLRLETLTYTKTRVFGRTKSTCLRIVWHLNSCYACSKSPIIKDDVGYSIARIEAGSLHVWY